MPATRTPTPSPAAMSKPPADGASGAVWAALITRPNTTAAELASAAGVGRSTAAKILVTLAARGLVTRVNGGNANGRRMPDRWSARQAAAPAAAGPVRSSKAMQPTGQPPAPDGGRPAADNEQSQRLAKNELRALVIAHLCAHPETAFTSTDLSKKLQRSSGAIANALERLTTAGDAQRTSDKPKRYQALPEAARPL